MAASGEAMSIMNLLLKPLWSRSWQMAPTNIDKHLKIVKRNTLVPQLVYRNSNLGAENQFVCLF